MPTESKKLEDDGIIILDSKRGKQFGFTSDLFYGYLWKTGNQITISLIFSLQERQGHLKTLFDRIESLGFTIAVPCPSSRMRNICLKRGMIEDMKEGFGLMRKKRNGDI